MDATEGAVGDERHHFDAPIVAPPTQKTAASAINSERSTRVATPHRWLSEIRLHKLSEAVEFERTHGNGFLFVPIFLAAGILIYFALPNEPPLLPIVAGLIVLGGVALRESLSPSVRLLLLTLAILGAGMLAAKLETLRAATPMLGSEISTRLTGRVERIEQLSSGRTRLTLEVLATARPELRYAPDRVRTTARVVPPGLRPGDVVEGVARLMPPSGPVRPQSFDFAFNSYFDGIGGIGYFLSNPEIATGHPPAHTSYRLWAMMEGWRLRMAYRISDQIGGPEGAIAAALITGIRGGIPESTNEALRIAGLYHVISISGLHMALVGGTVMLAMRAGFALAPTFSARRPVKKYAAATALLAAAFYLLMSGSDIAAQRSFLMLAVMLVAILADRSALTMRNLAISAIIILLISPHEVVGPSFQMSFAATAALVAAYAAWTGRREGKGYGRPLIVSPAVRVLGKTTKYAAGMAMTSVVAGAATALFSAWHFQQVSPMGLFANVAAMPFVSILVMPMAVLASVLMPLSLDGPPLQVMGFGIGAMNAIAYWLAERSAFDATGAIPLPAVLTLTTALAILTMSGSALRWSAAPLLLIGAVLLFNRTTPNVMISEDARTVAMVLDNSRLAVNRTRPQAFTIDNWQRALNAVQLVKPNTGENPDEGAFWCDDAVCIARHSSGRLVVHSKSEEAARATCESAALIVIEDATAGDPCRNEALVVTARDLARRGSAQVALDQSGERSPHTIRFALSEPYRPWHDHRRFSRAARGLAPYRCPE